MQYPDSINLAVAIGTKAFIFILAKLAGFFYIDVSFFSVRTWFMQKLAAAKGTTKFRTLIISHKSN